MQDGDVTIGELRRRIDRWEIHLDRQFEQVNRRLDNLQFVRQDVYTRDLNALEYRIIELEEERKEREDDRKWNRRALVGSYILPILVALTIAALLVQ